jgi:rubrerythrin
MANLFLASEILEISISEEINGAAFYAAVAENAHNELLKKTAAEISEQEKDHATRFYGLQEELKKTEPSTLYTRGRDDYLDWIAKNKIFTDRDAAEILARSKSDKETVQFALKIEEASLNLLRELETHVDENCRRVVQLTIEEEQQHVQLLNDLMKKIQ